MAPVEVGSGRERDEKLGAIGIGPRIGLRVHTVGVIETVRIGNTRLNWYLVIAGESSCAQPPSRAVKTDKQERLRR